MSETKKSKVILLLILLLSSLFIVGCSTHGKPDEEVVRYEFCPGKYFTTPSVQQAENMFYYATNQSTITQSAVYDTKDKIISGSMFKSPVNASDDNGGMWVADGFCRDTKKEYGVGTYTLKFSTKNGSYTNKKYMEWDNFPQWQGTPTFTFDRTNNFVTVTHSGITTDASTTDYTVKYRIKVYVNFSSYSQLFGQSETSNAGVLIYSLPKVSSSIELRTVLVAEMYQNGRIEKILFYPAPEPFTL